MTNKGLTATAVEQPVHSFCSVATDLENKRRYNLSITSVSKKLFTYIIFVLAFFLGVSPCDVIIKANNLNGGFV